MPAVVSSPPFWPSALLAPTASVCSMASSASPSRKFPLAPTAPLSWPGRRVCAGCRSGMPPPHAVRPSETRATLAARRAPMVLLTEARGKAAGIDALGELGVVGVQAQRAFEQRVFRLLVVGIGQAALDG